ncbi:MAG: hypothetical protein FWB74_03560 [Defluviitaleaceae bacterium]|nr:hypothetical protein [Defluviitaleaceae bacterium]
MGSLNFLGLVDIRDVVLDQSLPQRERLLDYVAQIKDPYLYKCDKVTVQIEFADTQKPC